MTRAELTAVVRGLAPVLRAHLATVLARERGLKGEVGPQGADGRPGRDGLPGVPGQRGDRGERGTDGLAGKDGKDGRDGTLEGVTVKRLGQREYEFLRADGSRLGLIEIPGFLDCGVYREADTYELGDAVTYAGSIFLAQRAVGKGEKPETSDAWRLAVKRGRDGKDGKEGKGGPQGPKGERGDPGRNFS